MRSRLGLEYLSVFGMPLLDYAEGAARLGCDFISLNFAGVSNLLPPYQAENLKEDAGLRARLKRRLGELGLGVGIAEGFALFPDVPVAGHARDLDAVAQLGARAICAISLDKDMARTHDGFAWLAEACASRGMIVTTELGAGVIRNLDAAQAALRAVDHPAFRLLIDTMHYFRRGAGVADLASLPAGAIGHVQLCDVPMPAIAPNYMEEALFERRALGDGDLPLAAFLAAVPDDVPVGLEIPLRAAFAAGENVEQRLGASVARARRWLDRSAAGREEGL